MKRPLPDPEMDLVLDLEYNYPLHDNLKKICARLLGTLCRTDVDRGQGLMAHFYPFLATHVSEHSVLSAETKKNP